MLKVWSYNEERQDNYRMIMKGCKKKRLNLIIGTVTENVYRAWIKLHNTCSLDSLYTGSELNRISSKYKPV
jgi:hypothetical protein